MITLLRTDSTHPDFREMVDLLNADLAIRNGDSHAFYSQYNGLESIRHAVVAYRDQRPVGCGAFKAFDGESVEIKRMFVHPDNRGKGIAIHILSELEAWAAEEGFAACVLETGLMLPEAIKLYEKCGYSRIPNFGQYQGVASSVCFKKALK